MPARLHPESWPFGVFPLALGTAEIGVRPDEKEAFALLDRYVERGGNFLDTARCYSDWIPGETGRSERVLGDWMRARGNRGDLILSTKGGHPALAALDQPRLGAEELRADLEESLRTLRVERIDLYWLHRDDVGRPVAEILEALQPFVSEGKVRALGASNWTPARLAEAASRARENNWTGFVANQPLWNIGSATMRMPDIPLLERLDAKALHWHLASGTPVVPYTAQAAGFFEKVARLGPDAPIVRESDYFTPENLRIAGRLAEMSAEKGVSISALVLAWLLRQEMAVMPIVGCRTVAQLDDSLTALEVTLSDAEMRQFTLPRG